MDTSAADDLAARLREAAGDSLSTSFGGNRRAETIREPRATGRTPDEARTARLRH